MRLRIAQPIAALALSSILGTAQSFAQNAYVTNTGANTVSVIDTRINAITATIPVPKALGVAVSPDGRKAYVTEETGPGSVVVIDTATNVVDAMIPVGIEPFGVAVTPDGTKLYVTNGFDGTLSVVDAVNKTVITTIPFGSNTLPFGVAVAPDGRKAYVAEAVGEAVSVIDTVTDTVTAMIPFVEGPSGVAVSPDSSKVYIATEEGSLFVIDAASNSIVAHTPIGSALFGFTLPGVAVSPNGDRIYVANNRLAVIDADTTKIVTMIPVGATPQGVAVTPDGSKVYVANEDSNNVSVIDTRKNKLIATISVGNGPIAFGVFIQPPPRFAGTPGKVNCYGKSVSALVRQYHGFNAAAAALGFSGVKSLQDAILDFCELDKTAEHTPPDRKPGH